MSIMQLLLIAFGLMAVIVLGYSALAGPSPARESERRLKASQLFAGAQPNDGEPPRIVIQPPDMRSIGGLADASAPAPTVRGQEPDSPAPAAPGSPVAGGARAPAAPRQTTTLYSWEGRRPVADQPAAVPLLPVVPPSAPILR